MFSREGDLVFCSDFPGIMEILNIKYDPEECRLFINQYASAPIEQLVHLKECYDNLEYVVNKLKYSVHKWTVCGDLKVIFMLLGQQSGYTKFPCFFCE